MNLDEAKLTDAEMAALRGWALDVTERRDG